jgi:hypothetical protein
MDSFKIGTIDNIAHFFHENLFYAIDAFLKNENIKWILHYNLTEWELKFTLLCAKHLEIHCEFTDLTNHRSGLDYDIKKNENFYLIMDMIQDIINLEYPTATFNKNYKVLYFRSDAQRRKMIGYENNLDLYFDEIIYDLNSTPFEKQVQLFMKCSHFVTIEGANLTNIIFMNKNAKVLNISPCENSWQLMFGTSYCVNTFESFILGFGIDNFNDNIYYSSTIENRIKMFLGV